MNRRLGFLMRILAAASLVLVCSLAARAYDYNYARVVRLSLAEGDVQLARPGTEPDDQSNNPGWEKAIVNTPIQQGYTLATGQGRAEVEFESGATTRLAENSVLQFTELALSNGGRITRLTLTQGTATLYANLSREDSFVVATPHLQVVIPKNARFRVDVSDAETLVSALKGEVEVDSRAGTNRLTKGHSLAYRTDDPDRVALDRNYKTDDWDRWVADRDEVVHTGNTAALQYVSSPYSYGLADLYNYGTWYPFSGYGLCWRPQGVGFNWSPFWDGRWAFFPGLGWTWVSHEPWGWLPYHYGRWVFSPALGWLWVPGSFRHWQPALVTWVRVGNHTGWVPLHPNDRPGHTPTNLQQGVILTGAGTPNTDRHERRLISRGENLEFLDGPPRGFAGAPRSVVDKTGGPPPVGSAGGNSDQHGIVFDPKERRFVNNPRGRGTKNGGDVGDAAMDTDRTSTPRGSSGTAQPKPSMQPPALRGPIGGPGGVPTGDGDAAPRKVSPPPPRMQPPPPPKPRVQPPPPAPPNSERPAPRSESPRPAPPPAFRMEPAPRPSLPRPEPRSEHPRAPARASRPDG